MAKLLPDAITIAGSAVAGRAGGWIAGKVGEAGGTSLWNALYDGFTSPRTQESEGSALLRPTAATDHTFVSIPAGR